MDYSANQKGEINVNGVFRSISGLAWICGGVIFAALLVLPAVIPLDWVHVSVQIMIMSIFALSVNLLLGYTGMIPFGEAAFFGVGAYTSALIILKTPLPFAVAIIASPVLAALLSVIIGWFCVRRRDIYFALLSFAFGEIVFAIIFKWYSFTGGDDGLVHIPVPVLLASITHYYYFVLVFFILGLIIFWLIVNAPFGKTLQAIRENPERVEFIGVNVRRYKLIAFVIAAFFSGLSGALFCVFNHNVFPVYAGWTKGAEPLFMCVIGGMTNLLGPVAGAVIFIVLEKVTVSLTQYWPFVMGVTLLSFLLYMRGGVLTFIHKLIQPEGR